ncbi:helix-turn-helix domain-containing protein [Christensenellaceae bacterium OttesenSCG-928-M15]|nr:helix-turn-helix domain-containing protein [Christensenellaceae bacterium OttesenSCG-928-M15]
MTYERIRLLREKQDLTQEKLAKAIHIPQRTYSNYETGSRTVPPEILRALAIFHKVSIDYILELTDEKTYPKRKVKSLY